MRRFFVLTALVFGAFVGLVEAGNRGWGPIVITREDEQKLILRLGEVRAVTSPGLALRIPFLDTARVYDRRWLHLTTEALPIQTQDGEQLMVDNYVIWRIDDLVAFRRSFPAGMNDARERIDRAVRDDVREVIGRHTLTQVLKDARAEILQEIGLSRERFDELVASGVVVST